MFPYLEAPFHIYAGRAKKGKFLIQKSFYKVIKQQNLARHLDVSQVKLPRSLSRGQEGKRALEIN